MPASPAPSAAPLRSMTGSGTFVHDTALGRFEAEARSVNHRFLKTTYRGLGSLPELGLEVEERVRQRVVRGHVTVTLRFTPTPNARGTAAIDGAAFAAASNVLQRAAIAAGLPPPTVGDVLAVPGVLGTAAREESAARDVGEAALTALDGALATFSSAREREGAALATELEGLLAAVERAGAALAERAAEVPKAWQARLRQRLEELLRGTGAALDPAALAREVAAMAERSDVREELARLTAHVEHARSLLAAGGPAGRPLDFLAQELARETNTVGSKANDLALQRTVIALKADVERLREQVQNLE